MSLNSERASANLIHTYLRIGGATANAAISEEEGFFLCSSALEHPLGNFAVGLQIDPWSSRRLQEVAASKPYFNVYSNPTDRPEHRNELLARAGFSLSYRLTHMVAEPLDGDESPFMSPVEPDQRKEVAEFMSNQFFARRPLDFREVVSQATARGEGLELYACSERNKIRGAVMVSEASRILGGYNLCVASSLRGIGIGSRIAKWLREEAGKRGLSVAIQCEAYLEPFYFAQGFEPCGFVDVFTLAGSRDAAIIEGK